MYNIIAKCNLNNIHSLTSILRTNLRWIILKFKSFLLLYLLTLPHTPQQSQHSDKIISDLVWCQISVRSLDIFKSNPLPLPVPMPQTHTHNWNIFALHTKLLNMAQGLLKSTVWNFFCYGNYFFGLSVNHQ